VINDLLRLVAAARRAQQEGEVPCFAHMRVRTSARTRDVLLGPRTSVGSEVTIIDWLRAPLAEVFFSSREGDAYEVEIDERTLAGTLLERHLLGFERGELVEIAGPTAVLRRWPGGEWVAAERTAPVGLALRRKAERRSAVTPLLADLDAGQRRAVELPDKQSLLVLGEAGFGKTVVALHRLAFLRQRSLDQNRRLRALVLVPTEGLRRLALSMLERLGIEDVEVHTFDAWIAAQARRVFADLPARDSRDTSAAVIRVKRHPALGVVLQEVAGGDGARVRGRARRRATRRRDLLHLFGDRALLERVVAESGGALTGRMLEQVLAHTHVQFSETTEEEFAHVDADRLATVDGRSIDDGTPLQDAGTIDVEDCAVLFALNYLRTGIDATSAGRLDRYDHIVLDEAQELAPLELAVVGRAVRRGGTMTVAGDEHQQVDDTAYFAGWPATMAELGASGRREAESVTLATSYRCPPAVEAFARSLFPETSAVQVRRSAAPEDRTLRFSRFASECHLSVALVDTLLAIRAEDPRATAAVICRTEATAERLHTAIRRGVEARLALAGDFLFEPGASVTCIGEVKGLEFDYVFVPDLSAAAYLDCAESRRALYVAVTRARHRLWLATTSTWSALAGRAPAS